MFTRGLAQRIEGGFLRLVGMFGANSSSLCEISFRGWKCWARFLGQRRCGLFDLVRPKTRPHIRVQFAVNLDNWGLLEAPVFDLL